MPDGGDSYRLVLEDGTEVEVIGAEGAWAMALDKPQRMLRKALRKWEKENAAEVEARAADIQAEYGFSPTLACILAGAEALGLCDAFGGMEWMHRMDVPDGLPK